MVCSQSNCMPKHFLLVGCMTPCAKSVHAGACVKTESRPKMVWGEVKEEAPQCNGPHPQLRNDESGAVIMPPLNKGLEEPKVPGIYIAIHYCIALGVDNNKILYRCNDAISEELEQEE